MFDHMPYKGKIIRACYSNQLWNFHAYIFCDELLYTVASHIAYGCLPLDRFKSSKKNHCIYFLC